MTKNYLSVQYCICQIQSILIKLKYKRQTNLAKRQYRTPIAVDGSGLLSNTICLGSLRANTPFSCFTIYTAQRCDRLSHCHTTESSISVSCRMHVTHSMWPKSYSFTCDLSFLLVHLRWIIGKIQTCIFWRCDHYVKTPFSTHPSTNTYITLFSLHNTLCRHQIHLHKLPIGSDAQLA